MKIRSVLGYRLLTATALGAAALGAILPLLPTTPFLLVAAWSASRHAPELEARLLANPRVGPHLHAWRRERALSRRAKVAAVTALALSLAITLVAVGNPWTKVVAGLVVSGVAVFLISRPEPREPGRAGIGREPGSCG